MKNKLTITVSGATNTGKSHIIKLISDVLQVNGFNVEIIPTLDCKSTKDFHYKMGNTAHQSALQSICENTEIVLMNEQTTQLNNNQINIK
jgi:uridine kinase